MSPLLCISVETLSYIAVVNVSSTFLGQTRSCDRPFKILATCLLLGHALKFLGSARQKGREEEGEESSRGERLERAEGWIGGMGEEGRGREGRYLPLEHVKF